MANRWQAPGAAEQIDAYWRGSPDEMEYRARLAALVHEQMETDGDTLLEVGCGTGLVYQALLQEFNGRKPHYTGLDGSKRMLQIARQRHATALLVDGDARALEFPDRYFDHAFAFEVFGHMPDCTQALVEVIRVAKKSAIFTLWVKDGLMAPEEGQDHFEYPADWVAKGILQGVAGANFSLQKRQMPWTMAYIVRKVQP